MHDGGHYFNEFDPFAAAWLGKLFPAATVDSRSIKDVSATDVVGYERAHFFGGIGGWEYALRLAGWPSDCPVWTGSCPCQPYSQAGKQKGDEDPRNLWPEFRRLIAECHPSIVFGEQVSSAIGKGWLDGVFADLEKEGYACAAIVLGAHSVGSPHIRQRLYWVADTTESRQSGTRKGTTFHVDGQNSLSQRRHSLAESPRGGAVGGLADADGGQSRNGNLQRGGQQRQQPQEGCPGGLANSTSMRGAQQFNEPWGRPVASPEHSAECAGPCGMEHSTGDGRQQRGPEPSGRGAVGGCGIGRVGNAECTGLEIGDPSGAVVARRPGATAIEASPWGNYDLLHCTDGKARRVESGTFPLAHGVPNRVGKLRGYGNAIVPQVAATFIAAYLDSVSH